MATLKNIAIMIICSKFFTFPHVLSSPHIIMRMKLLCIIDIGNFFSIPIPTDLINFYMAYGVDQSLEEYLTTEKCAKNAIFYLRDNSQHGVVGVSNFHGYNYYSYFRSFLKAEGFDIPSVFCTRHYTSLVSRETTNMSSEELYVVLRVNQFENENRKLIFEQICKDFLNVFPDTQKEILEYAFYTYNMEDFRHNFIGKTYMEHIQDELKLYPMFNPVQYCHNEVMGSFGGTSSVIFSDEE